MILDPIAAIKISAWVGFLCVILTFPFALFFGWLLARKEFPGKSLVNLILFLPLVLPPVVTGFLLLNIFGRDTVLGKFFASLGLPITFTLAGAVVASFVVGFPLFVMMVRSAFEAVDKRYEEIGQTAGMTSFQIFRKISLPLAYPGILAGAVLAFVRAMGEFGATSILSGNIEGQTRTIALAIYSLLESPTGMEQGRILIIASIGFSFASLAAYEVLLKWHRKRLELHE